MENRLPATVSHEKRLSFENPLAGMFSTSSSRDSAKIKKNRASEGKI